MQGQPVLGAAESAALDGLRGLAALIVVASHASGMGLHWVPGLSLVGIGKYGVYLFFVISAFLLTLQWLESPWCDGGAGARLWRYMVRRALRIYPLYIVVLLLGWLLPRGLGVPMDGASVWMHLTLREGRDIYWSVPVEFKFYLVIPLLAWGLSLRVAPAWKGLSLVLLVVLSLQAYPPDRSALNSIALGDYLPIFLCGSAAAWVSKAGAPPRAPQRTRALHLADLVALLLLFATVPAVLRQLGADGAPDSLHRAFLAWGGFWSLLLLAVVRGWLPGWAAALRLPMLRACGRWCFGIYLLHMPALHLAKRIPVPEIGRGWLGLAIALAAAGLVHMLVERPAMRWAARLTGRRAA